MKRISLLTAILLFFQLNLSFSEGYGYNTFAQINKDRESLNYQESSSAFDLIKNDLKVSLSDGLRLAKAPLHFNSDDWLSFGAVLGGTALAFTIDSDIRSMALRSHRSALDNVARVGKTYGEIYTGSLISGVVYVGGLVSGDGEVRKTGRMLFETLAFAGIVTSVAKSVLGRSRPYTNEGAFRYRGFQFKTETTSLPSGHVTVAFAVSSVLASRIDNLYASLGLYGLAGLTVFQRIYDDKHWLSDTILAASIGTFIGRTIVKYDEKGGNGNFGVVLFPWLTPSGSGLGLQIGI
ncbi:MAG TPA: phosphatase PAP2 family protein [Ignavibacteriales bacterium]|nr:phosphatase PAP2 family protein [Ignavibacteriales bacterium]